MLAMLGQKVAIAALCLSLGACATFDRAKPPPAVAGPVTVTVNNDQLSGWTDLPLGAYRVPESDVIVGGHQRGNAGVAMFGLLGLGIAHAANSNSSAAGVSNTEQILRIKLADQTRNEIEATIGKKLLADKLTTEPSPTQLNVSSALLLSYIDDIQVRPFTILKVQLSGADKRHLWETRYFASTGEVRPLVGTDSWTSSGGDPLKAAAATSLQRAVKVMLNDIAQPYTRDDNQMTIVEGGFPHLKPRVQIRGYLLVEDERYIAFVPKTGDASLLSGVSILDKAAIVYRPANSDDVGFKVLPEPPEREAGKKTTE
ncbi:hypothetical protein D3C71_1161640 [compost metagenome]